MQVKLRSVTSGSRRWLGILRGVFLIGAAVVLLVILIGRLHTAQRLTGGTLHSPTQGHPAPDFTVHTWAWWDALSAPKSALKAPTIPAPASETLRLAALKGTPVVVNFWASWCDPCRQEAPILQAAWQQYGTQGVKFVGVDADPDDPEQNSLAFLKQYGVTYFNGPDTNQSITISYGVIAIPVTVFIDRQGNIVSKHSGAIDTTALDASIQQLLA